MINIRVNTKRSFLLLFLILILFIMVIIPPHVPAYLVSLLTSVFMYMVLAVSWATFSAPTGYMSLASAAFFGLGTYVMAVLGQKLPLPMVIVFAGLASFLLAFMIGFASLRIRGIFFAMFTLGLSEFLRHFVNWFEIVKAGSVGRWVILVDNITCFYFTLIILIMTLLTSYLIRHSKFGLALRGIGEAEEAADHIGINTNALKIITFATSAFWMGAIGAITVTQWTYVDADGAFNMLYSFMPPLMAFFGGIGKIYGWVIGAIFFTLLAEVLLTEFTYYYMLLFGSIIISVFLFFPSGLVGVARKLRRGGLAE
jgi:branched-chain amino acid transport system permease protein